MHAQAITQHRACYWVEAHMSDQVLRMLAEAESRIHDAEILGTSLRSVGDSRALLNILALEVLLKAAQLKHSGTISRSHKYIEMWSSLPNHVRSEVLRIAQDRYPGHAELSNVEKLLCVYEFIFTKARYGYELYEDYTLAEQSGSGKSGSVAAPQQKKLTFNTSPWNCWPCLKAFARW